jgi:hypothetical protein
VCWALSRVAAQAEKNGIPWREEVQRCESDPSFQARRAQRKNSCPSLREPSLQRCHRAG